VPWSEACSNIGARRQPSMGALMIGEQQAAVCRRSLSQRLRHLLLVELPAWQLLALSAAVGAIWAASLFDWSFVAGRHTFWRFPHGTIGGSWMDTAQVLVGYLYYVQSPWRLPLFYVSNLGAPAGTNVILMDVVPIVAFIGKLVHSLTGATINLYGGYLFLCFALPGVMMTFLLIAARVRYGIAAVIAAIFADTMPTLLWRWGHIALMAQFLLIGVLALYLFSLRRRVWRGRLATWVAYLGLAYLIDQFLFVMVGIVWLCALIQQRLSRYTTTQEALGTALLTVASVSVLIALGGQFSPGSPLPFSGGYGHYSMNLLSPFVPQISGLFPGLGGIIDATGGQYEGFNYLGFGVLLASLLVLPFEVGWLRRNLRRHIALLVAFAALTAFAISHRAFVGHWLLFELPMPNYVNKVLGIFRSSGRFFWPIAYAQMAIVIVLSFRHARPLMAVCLAGATIVQLFDVQPLIKQIITSIADGPGAYELDPGQVAHLVAGARHLEVVPSFQCMDEQTPPDQIRANMELMLATARANVPTNSMYPARYTFGITTADALRDPSRARLSSLMERRDDYCKHEIDRARSGGRPGDVLVLLSEQPRPDEMVPGVTCSSLSWARYCQRVQEPREK
jgi:hypothetical protein